MTGTISTAHGTLTNPNILILISDQTRYPQHWPADWVAEHLKTWQRLMDTGLTFTNAFTAACECSPSRASFLTSTYPEENGVEVTFTNPLPPSMVNLANVLGEAGYPVVWKGKWHLSHPVNKDGEWSEADIAALATSYSMQQWNPPDAGTALSPGPALGGGIWNNDKRIVTGIASNDQQAWGTGALDFLNGYDPLNGPFCMVVSLVNPHDVFLFPGPAGGSDTAWLTEGGYPTSMLDSVGIHLPGNRDDDLTTKPSVQLQFRTAYDNAFPFTKPHHQHHQYVNFFARLHECSDEWFGRIYELLDRKKLLDNTLIIRMADHGEMGLSHGLREKMYTAYEEAIHVPLIFSNPVLWPTGMTTDALVSSLDLLPTLADIVGSTATTTLRGKSYLPVLQGVTDSVQDNVIYTFDDQFSPGPPADASGHIRCIRTRHWKYAVYFNVPNGSFEYEMYDLHEDPGELTNLLYGTVSSESLDAWKHLHHELTHRLRHLHAMPQGVTWPKEPWAGT